MTKPKSPCMGCTGRQTGCHSSCPAYKLFREGLDDYNASYQKYRYQQAEILDYTYQSHNRIAKNMGKIFGTKSRIRGNA